MEILYVYRGRERAAEIRDAIGKKHKVTSVHGPLHKVIKKINTQNTQILITFVDSIINKKVLAQMPKLKFIATQSTGTDHIDLKTCQKKKIKVSNVPGYGSSSVGELAMLLLLSVARNLKESFFQTHDGNFERSEERGFELKDRTIGIIGTGAIGAYVGQLAKGLGMKVILYDLHPDKNLARKLKAKYAKNIEELLPAVDVLSLHLPLLPSTRHMISYEEFALMKRGSVLINTARGGVIYSPALLEHIEKGHLRGAGLDVLEFEQYLYSNHQTKGPMRRAITRANRKLMHHPKVAHTLHLGAQTEEAGDRILETTITNLKAFISKKPINLDSE